MNRIELIHYKNKEIIRSDFRGLTDDDDLIAFLSKLFQYMKDIERPVRRLTLIEGVYFTPKVMAQLPKVTNELQSMIIKDAVIGVHGVKRILLQAYNAIIPDRVKAFSNEEDAKDWLVL